MNFISSPLMKSFVGFDNLFDEFDRISNFKDQSYPAYDIEKVSESEYKISLALAGLSLLPIRRCPFSQCPRLKPSLH